MRCEAIKRPRVCLLRRNARETENEKYYLNLFNQVLLDTCKFFERIEFERVAGNDLKNHRKWLDREEGYKIVTDR